MVRASVYFSLIIFLLLILTMGCSAMKENKNNQNIPECRTYADVERYYGTSVIIKGWYEVEPVPGGKQLQAASVVLADGTRLIHSYRPVKDMFCFINKRVMVKGIVMTDAGEPPEAQQVMAPHIMIETIALAPDEEPYDTVPEKIPDLPFVEHKKNLVRWNDRWAHVYGKLIAVALRPDESVLANAILQIGDGTKLCFEWVSFSRWTGFVNKDVTVTLLLSSVKEKEGVLHMPAGRTALCPGKVPRCGMSD
jgi:hypothetical protein